MPQNNPFIIRLDRHFKVWFSTQPEVFLPKVNQMRLALMRELNPNIVLQLIHCKDLLNDSAKTELAHFCREFDILCIDLPISSSEKVSAYRSKLSSVDAKLYDIARDQLQNLNQGGNPAIASDLIRLMYLEHGIYSDFDTSLDLPNYPAADPRWLVSVNQPFFFPYLKECSNNDVLALACYDAPHLSVEECVKYDQILTDVSTKIKARVLSTCANPYDMAMKLYEKRSFLPSTAETFILSMRDPSTIAQMAREHAQGTQISATALRDFLNTVLNPFQSAKAYFSFFYPEARYGWRSPEEADQHFKALSQEAFSAMDIKTVEQYFCVMRTSIMQFLVPVLSGTFAIVRALEDLNMRAHACSFAHHPVLQDVFAISLAYLSEESVRSDMSWLDNGQSSLQASHQHFDSIVLRRGFFARGIEHEAAASQTQMQQAL